MLPNILALQNEFDIFIFDIFGVLWDGRAMFPGALTAMKTLRESGKGVVVMSNSAAPSDVLVEEGSARGYFQDIHYDRIISAGDIAKLVFSNDSRPLRYYIYGHRSTLVFADSAYQEVFSPQEADFIYLGFPVTIENGHPQFSFDISPFVPDLQNFLRLEKPIVCANPDYKARVGDYPDPIICEGSLAAFYEKIDGKVTWFGKPYADIYEHLLQDCNVPRHRILMIGDTLRTDILGARNCGLKSALVLTGITAEEMRSEGQQDITAYAQAQGIVPDFYLQSV